MDLYEAAKTLSAKLREKPWFITVGVATATPGGEVGELICYVSHQMELTDKIPGTWENHRVRVVVTGPIAPAVGSSEEILGGI